MYVGSEPSNFLYNSLNSVFYRPFSPVSEPFILSHKDVSGVFDARVHFPWIPNTMKMDSSLVIQDKPSLAPVSSLNEPCTNPMQHSGLQT